MTETDVLILGAGAAGLMCAIHAGRRGRRVIVLERNPKIGEKIRISGGGRCNFTNRIVGPDHFISSNPDFVRSPLARFPSDSFIEMVKSHDIPFHEKTLGQLFCDSTARDIIEMLRNECMDAGVEIVPACEITEVARENDRFVVESSNSGIYSSQSLVVATGGLSVPKIGATDLGYRIARSFDVKIIETQPGLVPLTLNKIDLAWIAQLSGVSLDVIVQCNGAAFREQMLFTHRGLSGPAILQISSYWRDGDDIMIDLFPGVDVETLFSSPQSAGKTIGTLLASHFPKRFATAWCEHVAAQNSNTVIRKHADSNSNYPDRVISQLDKGEWMRLEGLLHAWRLTPDGTEGFEKAEVTRGGVDTRALSSKTMECIRVPGLYFVGEVVDVTGWLGGFNFQWAWASGAAAGEYA